MNKRNVLRKIMFVCAFSTILFTGCKSSSNYAAPFSPLTWDSTIEDMYEQEGNEYTTKDSYYGDTYSYACEYNGMSGTISYSFDDETLSCISFTYISDDGDDITAKYETLHNTLEKKYGESGETSSDTTTMTDIWRMETGNVSLIAVISTDYNALMYTCLAPDYSTLEVNN